MKLYEANDGRIYLAVQDGVMVDCSHQALDHPDTMATDAETFGDAWDTTDCSADLVHREDRTLAVAAEWNGHEMWVAPQAGPLARRYAVGG